MGYETKMTKGYSGWKATTEISLGQVQHNDLGQPKTGERVLRITTMKHNSGLVATTASVSIRMMTDRGYEVETTAIFGDFYKVIAKEKIARVTEKAVREFHAAQSAQFDAVKAEAEEFYRNKEAAA